MRSHRISPLLEDHLGSGTPVWDIATKRDGTLMLLSLGHMGSRCISRSEYHGEYINSCEASREDHWTVAARVPPGRTGWIFGSIISTVFEEITLFP